MILLIGISCTLFASCSTTYKEAAPAINVEELTQHTLQQLKACEGASLLDRESKVNIGKAQIGIKMINNRSDDSIMKMDSWSISDLLGWFY